MAEMELVPAAATVPTETAQIAIAAAEATARAEIEARVIVAKKFPRDEDKARLKVLRECERTSFAETALYRKPVGRKLNEQTGKYEQQFAVGFSIRFIEAALQKWGNVWTASRILTEDAKCAHLNVAVLDVENITGYSTDAIVEKLVERRTLGQGRSSRGTRANSFGDLVHLVEATADEFRNKLGAERSKLIRDNGQRLLPSDLLYEARKVIERTLAADVEQDPDAARKKILDAFASVGVEPEQLKSYLDRPLEALTPADLAELRILHNGLREGSFTWHDVMQTKDAPAEGEPQTAAPPRKGSTAAKVREKLLGARSEAKPETEKPPASE